MWMGILGNIKMPTGKRRCHVGDRNSRAATLPVGEARRRNAVRRGEQSDFCRRRESDQTVCLAQVVGQEGVSHYVSSTWPHCPKTTVNE